MRQQDYAKAEGAFREFIKRNPKDPLAANAQYWLGESFYVRGDYQQAAVEFMEGYKNYSNSPKGPENLAYPSNDKIAGGRNFAGQRPSDAPLGRPGVVRVSDGGPTDCRGAFTGKRQEVQAGAWNGKDGRAADHSLSYITPPC